MLTKPSRGPDRFQFSMRTLLLVVTGACLLLGFFEWVLPDDVPVVLRVVMYISIASVMGTLAWVAYRAKHRWRPPANSVTVQVDAKWVRRVKSPYIFLPIAALTGVSVSFAPLGIFWCARAQTFGIVQWIVTPLCFLVIYIVPGFYMRLAGEVIAQLHKMDGAAAAP